jgi:hypothetical protein
MSVRFATILGLLCVVLAVGVMYLPFSELYAWNLHQADLEANGPAASVSVNPLVAPTTLPFYYGRFVCASVFATIAAGCLVYLARRASQQTQG